MIRTLTPLPLALFALFSPLAILLAADPQPAPQTPSPPAVWWTERGASLIGGLLGSAS